MLKREEKQQLFFLEKSTVKQRLLSCFTDMPLQETLKIFILALKESFVFRRALSPKKVEVFKRNTCRDKSFVHHYKIHSGSHVPYLGYRLTDQILKSLFE